MNSKDALMFLINQAMAKGGKAAEFLGKNTGKLGVIGAEAIEHGAPVIANKMRGAGSLAQEHPKVAGAGIAGTGLLAGLAAAGAGHHEPDEEPDQDEDDDEYLALLSRLKEKEEEMEAKRHAGI